MLHILLFILKIIGWILLAILLLAVLLLCTVLFVPFKYKAEGSCEGDISTLYAKIRFSWLLHLIGGYAVYENGGFHWNVRIAWKTLQDSSDDDHLDDGDMISSIESNSSGTKCGSGGITSNSSRDAGRRQSQKETSQEDSQETLEKESVEIKCIQAESTEAESTKIENTKTENEETEGRRKGRGVLQKLRALSHKIKAHIKLIYQKIKYTFCKIYVTINMLLKKKNKLLLFMTDEIHKSALWGALMEIRRLLRLLKPRHVKIKLCFGFSNPSTTGQVLALISMMYPYVEGRKELTPDFEQKILEGTVAFRGKIRGLYAALSAWKLLMNKDIRTTCKHIKNFKL